MFYQYGTNVGPMWASPYWQAQIVPIWDPDGLSHYVFFLQKICINGSGTIYSLGAILFLKN